MYIHIFNFEF